MAAGFLWVVSACLGRVGFPTDMFRSYGIKLAGCKEVKAALRAQEDAEYSDDPDGKKRRLRKRRAAAKKRRALAKLAKQGGAPSGDHEHDEDDDDDDDDESDDEHEQVDSAVAPPTASTARAPPQITRPAPRPAARKTAAAGSKTAAKATVRAKPIKANAASAQPRTTTTTMQIEHLTQQHQSDPMMHWDNGNYQTNYGDMDDSGDDDYYPPEGFGTTAPATSTTTTTATAAAGTADPSGWTMLDHEKIGNVRTAATTLLGLALERSDVGLDNVQQNMISVLEWCRRQEETLTTTAAAAAQAVPRAPTAPAYQQPAPASTSSAQTTHHSARLPPQYATNANSHTPQPSSASRTAYTGNHAYANQYAPSTYSTLASAAAAAAAAAATPYQLPHTTAPYANAQGYQHAAQAQPGYQHGQTTYGTGYAGQGYASIHPYSSRIGI